MTAFVEKTVLDFGADATGKEDSSQAFIEAAAAEDVVTVQVPPGDYVIAHTVDLKFKNLRGAGRMRENQNGWRSRVRSASSLEGPMFINQGPTVEDMLIRGQSNTDDKVAFDAYAYNTVFRNLHFSHIGKAIHVEEILVNFTLEDCVFLHTGIGLYCKDVKESFSSTSRFVRNEFNTCGSAFVFRRQLNGATLQDNIFEAMSGDALVASHIYDCNFIGNWWEARREAPDTGNGDEGSDKSEDGEEEDHPAIRSTSYQQIRNCFAAGNKVTFGWRNVFNSDRHDAHMGGVSTQGGQLVVRESAGRAMRLTTESLVQQGDTWAAMPTLLIEAGRNKASMPKGVTLRTKGGPVSIDDDERSGFTGSLSFAKGDDLYERYSLTRNAAGVTTVGMTGVSEMMIGGEKVKLVTGIPQHFLWRTDGLSRGLACFTTNEVTTEGTVKLGTDYLLDNPIVQVTVEDPGIRFNGLKHVNSYVNNGQSRRQCQGFELYFTDLEGTPVTPTAFAMQMLTLNPSLLTT